ncbi:MAG: bifunctional nuclease family protein [Acidimicrobiales bacterium]
MSDSDVVTSGDSEAGFAKDGEAEIPAHAGADFDSRSYEGAEPEAEVVAAPVPEQMSQVLFVDVALVLPSTHPVVVLQEADSPYRELRIPVGGAEGVAIGYAARQVATPRPLTHEMLSRLLDAFDLTLDAVRITAVEGSNFVAELRISGPGGVRCIDCRPSDAIALALRRSIPVPIMAAPYVLELAGGASPSGN